MHFCLQTFEVYFAFPLRKNFLKIFEKGIDFLSPWVYNIDTDTGTHVPTERKGVSNMTMNEKKMESIENEIAKIAASLERYKSILAKKTEQCIKLNCNWTSDEYRNIMKQFHARHEGECVVYFGEDDDLITKKQNSAWVDRDIAEDNVEDCKRRLENAERRYAKISETVRIENEKNEEFRKAYEHASEMERQMLLQKEKEEYEKWLAWFKAECLKDGVVIEDASNSWVNGITPSGKKFVFYLNNGYTERSWHCYSLYIDGKTIFTSGEFWRCYNTVKHH